jgi:Na+/melibiose symporter-like transporter
LIAGIALDVITLSTYTDPENVPQSVLTEFGLLYALIALISILALWVLRPYSLNRQRHGEIMLELQEIAIAAPEEISE